MTLIVATIAGMFLQRHRFPGRAVLIAMLTFPLAFPGVVVGFMVVALYMPMFSMFDAINGQA